MRFDTLRKAYGWVLGVAAAATLTLAPASVVAAERSPGAPESLSLGRQLRLSTDVDIQGLLIAAPPRGASELAADPATAVVWSDLGDDLKGRLVGPGNAGGIGLALGQGQPVALAFASDGALRVGSREPRPGDDAVHATRFLADGSLDDSIELDFVDSARTLAMGFFDDGGVTLAVAGGDALEVTVLSPEGVTIGESSLSPVATAGEDRFPRVSVHGDEVLVGWDRFAACGGSKERHVAVVARLDRDAQRVRRPRRFSSGGCGQAGKRLRLLDGPSMVGSLAVFQDRSARRFITGQPPQSELEFELRIASGEEVAALAMDDGAGRILAVTRTTAAGKPVRLFVQGFGRDGQSRTPKVSVDGGVGSAVGFAPSVAAVLSADGNARIAFTRSGSTGGNDGLFLRELVVRIP